MKNSQCKTKTTNEKGSKINLKSKLPITFFQRTFLKCPLKFYSRKFCVKNIKNLVSKQNAVISKTVIKMLLPSIFYKKGFRGFFLLSLYDN
jgi:hypothetical protein